jgi:glycosyltransferase involved in cell wall biosynthesis
VQPYASDAHTVEGQKVLFVLSVGLIAIPVLREQLAELSRRGVRVTVAAAHDPELENMVRASGANFEAWSITRDVGNAGADLSALSKLIGIVRRLRPDVVVAGTPKAGLLGVVAGRVAGVPKVIYTLHGLRLEGATGWRRHVLWAFEKATCQMAHIVHAVGPHLASRTTELRLAPSRKVVVVGAGSASGINCSRFHPVTGDDLRVLRRDLKIDAGATVVGFVGRVTHDKGIQALVRLVDRWRVARPDVLLVIVGDADWSNPLDAPLVKSLSDATNVRMVGRQTEVERYMAALDLMVLPSLREGLPTVVLEAAACGVPSVITDCTGARDAVVHETTGLVVPQDDSEAFVSAATRLVDDGDLRRQFGRAGRKRVLKNFEATQVTAALADFYLRAPKRALETDPELERGRL